MSYSLSISGHHGDPTVAEQIDNLVRDTGADLVAKILDLDPSAVAAASFGGPTGSVNFLAAPAEPESAPAEDQPEAADPAEDQPEAADPG